MQRNSVPRLSTWGAWLGWVAGGLVAVVVGIIVVGQRLAEHARPRSGGMPSWLGLAVVFGGALVFEDMFLPTVWPAVMRDFVPAGTTLAHALAIPFVAHVRTRLVGCESTVQFEVDDEALEGMSEDRRDEFLAREAQDALVAVGAYEIWWTEAES